MKKVLIVDSDVVSAKLCADDFLQAGHYIEIVTQGKSVVPAVERLKPDVVVLAYFLEDMDAAQVLAKICEKPALQEVAVVVLIPAQRSELIPKARKAGATKWVVKERGWDRELRKTVRDLASGAAAPQPAEVAPPEAEPEKPETVLQELAAPEPEPPPAPAPSSTAEAGAAGDLRRLKELSVALLKSEEGTGRVALTKQFSAEARELLNAWGAGKKNIASSLAAAFLDFLNELTARPANLTTSTLRTISQTVQSLGPLLAQTEEGKLPAAEQFSVLAVDDEAPVRRLVSRALGSVSLKVETAKDAAEAIQRATAQHWDLFLLDVNMPNMNGFDLCAKLRGLPTHRKTPVVFLTGCNDIEHRLRFARSKADDFIAKPFLISELIVKVLGHLLELSMKRHTAAKQNTETFRPFGH